MTLVQYLIENNGKPENLTWLDLANMFNIKPGFSNKKRATKANDIWRTYIKSKETSDVSVQGNSLKEIEEESISHNIEKGEITINTYYSVPPSPQQIIKDHRIDTKQYQLVNYYSKAKTKGWLVTANFKAISVKENVQGRFMDFLKSYNPNYEALKLSTNHLISDSPTNYKNMLEISIPDLHIDKRGLEGMSFDEMSNTFLSLIKELAIKASNSYKIEKIVFVAGNDFFNTDNIHNATASHMNVQEINETWYNAYTKGFDLLVKVIEFLRSICPNVHVVSVPGNHGKSKEFYLVHALSAFFRNVDGLTFDIGTEPRKLLVYGDTSIMYHHGNCKLDSLPTIMAQEFRKEWGETKFKRIHTGDKHHFMEKEINGVIIKQFPSLSQTDTWHNENNYILNQRKALVLVHNYYEGLVATFEKGI